MMTGDEVVSVLDRYYERASAERPCLGVFLNGSQNYRMATDASDVDAHAITLPTPSELAFGKERTHTYHMDEGELKAKDAREAARMLLAQGVNFLEVVTTRYAVYDGDAAVTRLIRKDDAFRRDVCDYDLPHQLSAAWYTARNMLEIAAKRPDREQKELARAAHLMLFVHARMGDADFATAIDARKTMTRAFYEEVMALKRNDVPERLLPACHRALADMLGRVDAERRDVEAPDPERQRAVRERLAAAVAKDLSHSLAKQVRAMESKSKSLT